MTTNTIDLPRNMAIHELRTQPPGHRRDRLEPQEQFGQTIAARLADGTSQLPYDVTERLRAARTQALAMRKREVSLSTVPAAHAAAPSASTTWGGRNSVWHRIASALPLLALAAGLVLIHSIENERRASEVAEVDAALLTDDLPPAAYADPGFAQFLKTSAKGATGGQAESAGRE